MLRAQLDVLLIENAERRSAMQKEAHKPLKAEWTSVLSGGQIVGFDDADDVARMQN